MGEVVNDFGEIEVVFDSFAAVVGQTGKDRQKTIKFEFLFVFLQIENSYFAYKIESVCVLNDLSIKGMFMI